MNISQKKLEKSKGRLEIKIKDQNLQKLFQQGSLKALIPDFHENLESKLLEILVEKVFVNFDLLFLFLICLLIFLVFFDLYSSLYPSIKKLFYYLSIIRA